MIDIRKRESTRTTKTRRITDPGRHFDRGGETCPYCESRHTKVNNVHTGPFAVVVCRSCRSCEALWRDCYTLDAVTSERPEFHAKENHL